jgi:alkylresorcinol/alkylpyrone synthase
VLACARPNDPSVAMFVAAASFGDGVAAMVLRSIAAAASERATGAHRGIMGWDMKADGFASCYPQLSSLMHQELRPALEGFLKRHGLEHDGFCGFLSPRGPQDTRDRGERTWHRSRTLGALLAVLRDCGHLSSASLVLQRALRAEDCGAHLLAAFGLGFSAYFATVEH